MYIWLDRLRAVNTIIRMGRGAQMGVDHNKGFDVGRRIRGIHRSRPCRARPRCVTLRRHRRAAIRPLREEHKPARNRGGNQRQCRHEERGGIPELVRHPSRREGTHPHEKIVERAQNAHRRPALRTRRTPQNRRSDRGPRERKSKTQQCRRADSDHRTRTAGQHQQSRGHKYRPPK